tara:strand:+ start:540 stop:794 length:255 start_codon:yes stop_codon:yes gene_type:complete
MTNKEILKKQIIYRSTHRGSKEMDILLGNFVKKHIDSFNITELKEIQNILFIEDEIIHQWYFNKKNNTIIPNNRISQMLKEYKI